MEIEKTEQYVKNVLVVVGYDGDNTESHLYDLLFHQYMAAALYETASAADRSAVDVVAKKLKGLFECKFKLKETTKKKKKHKKTPPHPQKKK